MENYQNELEISEEAWKQAVVVIKILDAMNNKASLLKFVYKSSIANLRCDNVSRQTVALHILRFLCKSNRASIGWFAKRRILGMLRSHQVLAVRLAALDVLGAVLTQTGSRSGVQESDYADMMDFRKQMLNRSRELEAYEKNEATAMAARYISEEDPQVVLNRLTNQVS